MKRSGQELSLIYFFSDVLALNATLIAALFFYQTEFIFRYDGLTMVGFSLMWVLCASFNKVYHLHLYNSFMKRVRNYVISHFAFVGSVSAIYLIFTLPNYIKAVMITFVIAFPIVNLLLNYGLFKLIGWVKGEERKVRKALIVGAGKAGINVYNHFRSNPDFGYTVVGFLDANAHLTSPKDYILGDLTDVDQILSSQHIDEVIITLSAESAEIKKIVERADYYGVRIRLIPDYSSFLGESYSMSKIGEMPVVNVREISLDTLAPAMFKRLFDMVFSACVLIMLSPVFLFLAIAIKLDSPGAVFYCPIRVGRDGRKFKLYKFRSMVEGDSANGGTRSTMENDERITKLGKIIRKYSLDELPQFLNVFFGDMSVVGPRPHRVYLNNLMQKEVDHYMVRHYLKPGITGWAQVNGWRGPTDTEEQRNQRTEHDLWYIENWTLGLDIKIIYLTVFGQKTHEVAF